MIIDSRRILILTPKACCGKCFAVLTWLISVPWFLHSLAYICFCFFFFFNTSCLMFSTARAQSDRQHLKENLPSLKRRNPRRKLCTKNRFQKNQSAIMGMGYNQWVRENCDPISIKYLKNGIQGRHSISRKFQLPVHLLET